MTQFTKKSFSVGSTDSKSQDNYRDNHDKVFGKKRKNGKSTASAKASKLAEPQTTKRK